MTGLLLAVSAFDREDIQHRLRVANNMGVDQIRVDAEGLRMMQGGGPISPAFCR